MVLQGLSRTTRQDKQIKGIQVGKEEVKLSLVTEDMIFYVKIPKKSKHTKATMNKFNKVSGYKIKIQNLIILLYMCNDRK